MNTFHTPTVTIPNGQWSSNKQIIEAVPSAYSIQSFDSLFPHNNANSIAGAQGYVTYIPISEQCIAQVITGRLHEQYCDKTVVEGWIGFQFALDGEHISVIDGYGQINFCGPRFSMCANTDATRVAKIFPANRNITYVNLIAKPQFLLDQFGVELHQLPTTIQAMLNGEQASFYSATQPLTPGMISAAEELTQSNFSGKLQQTFAKVKSMELLCLAIEALTRNNDCLDKKLKLCDRDIKLLHQVRDDLGNNFSTPLSLAEMSRHIGMNRNKLSLGFKELFGSGVYEYCQQLRMREAKILLQQNRLSILDIALEIGFQNQSSFSRAYKNFYGRAPSMDQQN